jgi:hypothetical protein
MSPERRFALSIFGGLAVAGGVYGVLWHIIWHGLIDKERLEAF